MIQFGTIFNSPSLFSDARGMICNKGSGGGLLNAFVCKNKNYLEIKLDKLGEAPYIGICNADTYKYNGYPPYNNNDNLITTSVYQIKKIGVLSIKLDCINKHVTIILNDNNILIDKDFTFNNVNIVMGVGSAGGSGNGGTFRILNKNELAYKMPVGFYYYGENKKNKYLLKQNNNYYSINNNYQKLGNPKDSLELKNWYNRYGFDDINIITQNLNNKEFPITKDENGVWKTDFGLNMNDITDNIDLIDVDENNKSIKYSCNNYRIIDLCDDEFDIRMYKEKQEKD